MSAIATGDSIKHCVEREDIYNALRGRQDAENMHGKWEVLFIVFRKILTTYIS